MQDFQVIKQVGNTVEMSKLFSALKNIAVFNLSAHEKELQESEHESRPVRRIYEYTFSFTQSQKKVFLWSSEWLIDIQTGVDCENNSLSMFEINLYHYDERTLSWEVLVKIEIFNLPKGLFQIITVKEFLAGNQHDFNSTIDKIHQFVMQFISVHHLPSLQPLPFA